MKFHQNCRRTANNSNIDIFVSALISILKLKIKYRINIVILYKIFQNEDCPSNISIFFFSLVLILTTLSISRHYYLGGSRMGEKVEIFEFLSELLPNTYHFIQGKGLVAQGLFTHPKKDIKPNQFKVPGLFPLLTKDGWVIVDIGEKSQKIIPVEWSKFKKNFLKFNTSKNKINSKNHAAPFNPIKSGENLIFSLGSVLFKYNFLNESQAVFKGNYHHSIELFQDSLLYACFYGADTLPNLNDAIIILNINSMKPIFQKSISEILLENNYEGLLYGSSNISSVKLSKDIIHLNDIQPIRMKTNFAEVGDLLISMRNLSTVMLYRPTTNKVLWLSQGPWLNQHDVDVINNNEIGVYNNNFIREIRFNKNETSHVVTYNFKTKKFGTLHKSTFKKYNIKSVYSSRFEILDNGNMFLEDSPSGAYYLINPQGKLI
jgi:hypothetical protein